MKVNECFGGKYRFRLQGGSVETICSTEMFAYLLRSTRHISCIHHFLCEPKRLASLGQVFGF
jgi:hypothetical protein